ncbi:unnamed protein product, partial [Dibothriocephalus latus]
MAVEEIFTTVDSRDLWRALSLSECLRFSPQFQLALKTGEREAGQNFAKTLRALGDGLLSILTPCTALPLINLDDETATKTADSRLKLLLNQLTEFSELTKKMAEKLYEPSVQLQKAAENLEHLHPLRKVFSRAGEQLESALSKSASVPRNRPSEAKEADSGVLESRSTYSDSARSYLAELRAGLGPLRLDTCFRCTAITFRTESTYMQ